MSYTVHEIVGPEGSAALAGLDVTGPASTILHTILDILATLPGVVASEVNLTALAQSVMTGTKSIPAGSSTSVLVGGVIDQVIVDQGSIFVGHAWFRELAVTLLMTIRTLHVL